MALLCFLCAEHNAQATSPMATCKHFGLDTIECFNRHDPSAFSPPDPLVLVLLVVL